MLAHVLHRAYGYACAAVRAFRRRLGSALRPATTSSLVLGAATDLVRSKPELIAENALLRQQVIVLARSTKRPRISRSDRALPVLLASRVRAWRQALLIVQPATLLRWLWGAFIRSAGGDSYSTPAPARWRCLIGQGRTRCHRTAAGVLRTPSVDGTAASRAATVGLGMPINVICPATSDSCRVRAPWRPSPTLAR